MRYLKSVLSGGVTGGKVSRRSVRARAVALATGSLYPPAKAKAANRQPYPRWYETASKMRRLAKSWGDQPYGDVLVMDGTLVGQGPSHVVKNRNPDAHAEREAILDAQRKLGWWELTGAVLYSTSRPCDHCEAAAAQAGVDRMYFGALLTDAGTPRPAP